MCISFEFFDYVVEFCCAHGNGKVALLKPQNLEVNLMHLKDDEFAMNLTWSLPEYLPDYYVLKVFDLSQKQSFHIIRGNYHLSKVINMEFMILPIWENSFPPFARRKGLHFTPNIF